MHHNISSIIRNDFDIRINIKRAKLFAEPDSLLFPEKIVVSVSEEAVHEETVWSMPVNNAGAGFEEFIGVRPIVPF